VPTIHTCPRCGETLLHLDETTHCPHCKWIGLKAAAILVDLDAVVRVPDLPSVCPGTSMYPILINEAATARGYWPCNPSLVASWGEMWLTVRLVNYKLDTRHRPPYRSHTLVVGLSDNTLRTMGGWGAAGGILLDPSNSKMVLEPEGPRSTSSSQGLEDIRLIPRLNGDYSTNGNSLRAIACVCDRRSGCSMPQQATFWIRPDTGETGGLTLHPSPLPEKNWCPVLGFPADEQHYIYSLRPWTSILRESLGGMREVGRYHYLEGQERGAPMLSGSTQAIPFEDGYLMLAHDRAPGRVYRHRWVKLGSDLRPVAQSNPFYFRYYGVEFACGLAWAPVDAGSPRLLVTFGVHDDEAWIVSILAEEVSRCLA
jgi:hypothetical protein